jgi:hypothetical protein
MVFITEDFYKTGTNTAPFYENLYLGKLTGAFKFQWETMQLYKKNNDFEASNHRGNNILCMC